MTKSEIIQNISQLERDIADMEKRRAEAERNIRQLEALYASCNNYQAEFEQIRTARKIKLEHFGRISGQARLVGEYDAVLGELLNGSEYVRAYGDMNTAKSEIDREIEKQRQAVNECSSQIAGFHGSISHWQQQLASADRGAKDAE